MSKLLDFGLNAYDDTFPENIIYPHRDDSQELMIAEMFESWEIYGFHIWHGVNAYCWEGWLI